MAFLFLTVGAAVLAAGLFQLDRLARAYRDRDLFLVETPESFRAWLVQGDSKSPEVIAQRLLFMGLPMRRQLVFRLIGPGFWRDDGGGRALRAARAPLQQGIAIALSQAPAAGDLYLALAWLEAQRHGLNLRVRLALRASQVFMPREFDLALRRAALLAPAAPVLPDAERAILAQDIEVVRALRPVLANLLLSGSRPAGP